MNKRDITIVVAGIVLLGTGFVGGALFFSFRNHHALTTTAPTAVIPAPAAPLLAAASTEAAPVPEPPAAQPTPDKTRTEAILPAVGSKSDGKEVLTDGKEVLAPVSELVGTRPGGVNLGPGGLVPEYRSKNRNQLLDPPSQENVGGPVVSPETR